jgi:thioredoxin-like negative regulator of GroEL
MSRALAASLTAGLWLATPLVALAEPAIAWARGWKDAERRARSERKPLLVDFWAEWCEWCHELDRTTYRDARVVELSQRFVPVKVNAEGSLGEAELAGRYDVATLPTMAFLSPGGRVLLRRTAFEGPEAFAATMEAAQRLAEGAIAFEESLAKDGKDAAALAGLGALLAGQPLSKDARELLGRARKLDAARPVAERKRTRRLLAEIERARGRKAESLALIAEALALQPADAGEDAAAAQARAELVAR